MGEVQEFPNIADDEVKNKIIRDWQNEMNVDKWKMAACAVCTHRTPKKDIQLVHPDQIDFTLLQNPHLPDETLPTTYNLGVYQNTILYPKGLHDTKKLGMIDMCSKCESALVERNEQPKDALANWQYTGFDELPDDVQHAFQNASMFDIMMIARSRATRITHLFSKKKGSPNYGQDPSESQRYDRGNISVIPQDSAMLRQLLPPDESEIQMAMTALFAGGKAKPTIENISQLSPVLVSKSRVHVLLNFLLDRNVWYRASDVGFSADNFANMFAESDAGKDEAIPKAVDICWLPEDEARQVESANADYTDHNEYARSSDEDELAMEAVGYTAGDRTPQNYRIMKASALAWCLSRKKFIKIQGGSELLSDRDPAMLTFLFPHLDPWGIAGFYQCERTVSQQISFEHQVRNLLMQDNSPFQADPSFAYVCWNILQKREVNKTASFRTSAANSDSIVSELNDLEVMGQYWHGRVLWWDYYFEAFI